jgi:hypothetical protein
VSARQFSSDPVVKERGVMRYLCSVADDEVFAYARNRRDFYLAIDDSLWAHESHNWLLSAESSVPLMHRIGRTYYDAETALPVYYETTAPVTESTEAGAAQGPSGPRHA